MKKRTWKALMLAAVLVLVAAKWLFANAAAYIVAAVLCGAVIAVGLRKV